MNIITIEEWKALTSQFKDSREIEWDAGGYPISGVLSDESGNDIAGWGPWYEDHWVIVNSVKHRVKSS